MLSRLQSVMFLLFVFVLQANAQSQSIKLSGKVLNDKNEPLVGVSIKVEGVGGTATDHEINVAISVTDQDRVITRGNLICLKLACCGIEDQCSTSQGA